MNRRPVMPLLFVVVAATNACGFVFSKGPPAGHEQMEYFTCTESNTGPILDLVWAGLNVLGVLAIAADPDTYEETYGYEASAGIAIGLAWGVGSSAAAATGFSRSKKCREAKLQLAQRQSTTRSPGAAPPRAAPPAVMLVQSVVLTPQNVTLEVGQTQQMVAAAYHSSGVTIPDRSYTWSSSNDAIASVSDVGLVTANGAGFVTIAAKTGNMVGTTRIQVVEKQ